jgi:hypothetical protein
MSGVLGIPVDLHGHRCGKKPSPGCGFWTEGVRPRVQP